MEEAVKLGGRRLDVDVEATGFNKKLARELEGYMKEVGVDGDANGEGMKEGDEENAEKDEDDMVETVGEAGQEELLELAENSDLAVQPPTEESTIPLTSETLKLVDGMTILQLSETKPLAHGGLPSIAPSHAGTTSSRRPPPNPAKAARGWAI